LWNRIKYRTRYSVDFATEDLIAKAAKSLAEKPTLTGAFVRAKKSEVTMDDQGVTARLVAEKAPVAVQSAYPVPDLLGHLTRHLPVSRSTIAKVLIQSGRLGDATKNPQQFLDYAQLAIEQTLADLLVDGITYEKIGDGENAVYEMRLFEDRPLRSYVDNLVAVTNDKSVYQEIAYDSEPERQVAIALDQREDIKFFLKLPGWFKVDTPIGGLQPGLGHGEDRCRWHRPHVPRSRVQAAP